MKKLTMGLGALCAMIMTFAGLAPAATALPLEGAIFNANKPNSIKNRYIIILKDDFVAKKSARSVASNLGSAYAGKIRQTFNASLKGFVADMSAANAKRLAGHPSVRLVEQDAIATADGTQLNPNTWGLDRIDQSALPLNASYTYPNVSARNVTAYVIDSGIRTSHGEFGGRASNGWDFVDNDAVAQDCNGHGTHVAGVIGGTNYGVAKDVKLVAVRVLNCSNSGSYSNIIAGIDWVTAHAARPAVANLSLGGVNSLALDAAVENSIASGITYSVSAGNNNTDACTQSPARAASALTVAASSDLDERWSSSNYGTCVDLFAPGTLIRSAYGSSDTSTARMSGTSAAAPHVTGVAALKIAANPTWTPTQVSSAILSTATTGALTNVGGGSPNMLLFQ